MKRFNAFTLVAVASLFFAFTVMSGGVAGAVPIQWTVASGGNGHWYEHVYIAMEWHPAKTFYESRSHLGLQGHLFTITSAAEGGGIPEH